MGLSNNGDQYRFLTTFNAAPVVSESVMYGCECIDNVSKENYVFTIFAVLITLYVNSRLDGSHKLMVFTIIVFMNTRENIFRIKTVSKSAP